MRYRLVLLALHYYLPYGLAFGLVQTAGRGGENAVLHRYGWGGYYSTQFWIDPRHDMTGVFMTQVLPTYSSGRRRCSCPSWPRRRNSRASTGVTTRCVRVPCSDPAYNNLHQTCARQTQVRQSGHAQPEHAQVVGRLAPSPTGGLHLGHAATFLIAWLAVRRGAGV